jgi:UDP-N-acetylmuramoyl-L-alanyl-D-glutamate--2,6-diaminopimelate ligase
VRTFAASAVHDALDEAGLLKAVHGSLPSNFHGITDDSRQVESGTLFIAVRGTERDGHDYLSAASAAGASGAILEQAERAGIPAFVVSDGRAAAGVAGAAAFGEPSRELNHALAVTGTNGKSTTVSIIRHLMDETAARAASIGTIGSFVGSVGAPLDGGGGLTTPGPIELQRLIRDMVDRGVKTLAIEASSHSLDQHRIGALSFDAAVFTNLTRDHLDYHGTMDRYLAAKAQLLGYLRPSGIAVINADDPSWHLLPAWAHTVRFSALGETADLRALGVRSMANGSRWELTFADAARYDISLPLIGDFNVANALGAATAAWALGVAPDRIAERLSRVPQVPGRLEVLHGEPTVLRDYAHTPDALERAISALRPLTRGRLIVVFGAGGDRDRGKRPQMGAIADRLADISILTSDNPRTEDPERILDDIEQGMTRPHERIEDREQAVKRAIELADRRDVVLLAGKGHETYQVRGTTHFPFDERAIVDRVMGGR